MRDGGINRVGIYRTIYVVMVLDDQNMGDEMK